MWAIRRGRGAPRLVPFFLSSFKGLFSAISVLHLYSNCTPAPTGLIDCVLYSLHTCEKKRYWCIAIDGPLLAVFKTASASSRRAASFNSRASVTSLGVRWGHPQSDPPWTYIRRCEIALSKFDEAIEWSDISPSEIESELEAWDASDFDEET